MDHFDPSATPSARPRFFIFLRKYWWVPVITLVLSLGAAVAYDIYLAVPEFVSTASMWETEKLRLPEGAAFTEDVQNYMGTQVELLRSKELGGRAVARLRESGSNAVPIGKDGDPLKVIITVKQSPKSAIFVIEAASANPAYSPAYLDALLREYLAYKKDVRKTVSGDTLASISEQVLRLEGELKSEQDALTTFERTNNLAILEEEGRVSGSYLAKLQTELSDLKLESQLLDATALDQGFTAAGGTNTATNAASRQELGSAPSMGGSADHLSPFQEVELLKSQREKLSQNLRPKHPKIVRLDEQIERDTKIIEMVRHQDREQAAATRQTVHAKMTNVLVSIRDWEGKVMEANARMAEADRLKINVSRTQSVYDRLVALVQNVDISRNIDQDTMTILQHPTPAIRSYSSEISLLEASGFGGLALGLGIIFLIGIRDDRFTSLTEVTEKLGENIVGQLPELRRPRRQSRLPLLEADDSRHMYAESYRSLRSALLFMPVEGERPKTMLITSALPNEGKSTVAANLARTLAHGGARVLLVDADLRKGVLDEMLGMQREPGLAELLRVPGDPKRFIQQTTLPNLSLLARGGNSILPGEIFLSRAFIEALAAWREQFDHVLIDSTPVFAADDATTIAPVVDGTIFVVRGSQAGAKAVREALEMLYQRQARVLGLIFNGANAKGATYYHYKYAGYYQAKKTL
jgi:capsular exopolysaccharide synthesis family protein